MNNNITLSVFKASSHTSIPLDSKTSTQPKYCKNNNTPFKTKIYNQNSLTNYIFLTILNTVYQKLF